MYSQPKRIEFLDSLRGLAALFVLLGHTNVAFEWPISFSVITNLPFISILFGGKEAVAMFFVLSGYVLSKPYIENAPTPPRRIFLPTFYLRRFIRIWPPWFFAFIISIFAQKFLFFQPATKPAVTEWLNSFWQVKLTAPDFFRQCAFALHDSTRLLLNQDWSLGVELKGSALIPLFVFCARRKNMILIILLSALFLIFVGTGQYYVSFIIGALLAQYDSYFFSWLARLGKRGKGIIFIGGLFLYQTLGLASHLFPKSPSAYKYGWMVTAVGCAVIIISVFGSQLLQRALNCKPFVFLGRISYSIYLLQFIIILCLLPPLVTVFNSFGISQPLILFPMTILASVGATVSCAAVMYRFIEVPVINFGHWLTKKIQRRFENKNASAIA